VCHDGRRKACGRSQGGLKAHTRCHTVLCYVTTRVWLRRCRMTRGGNAPLSRRRSCLFHTPSCGDLRACSAHTRAHAHTHTQHHSPHAILTPPHLHQQAMSHMHAHDNNWRVLTSAHPAGAPPCLLSAWEGDYCSPVVHDHVWLRACAGVCARRFAPSPRAPINAHSPRAPHVVNQ
jgi:hypothetical protein